MTSALPDGPPPAARGTGAGSDNARRLVLVATEAFSERGYHATTTRDIAAAAGMSPAALYVHFPSKVALLFAIARNGHEQALDLVRHAVASSTDPERRVRRIVVDFVAWHARQHRIARVVQYELHALPEPELGVVRDLRRRTEQLMRDVITEGVAAGRFQVPDVATAARAVLSLGIDVARWYTSQTRPSPDELGRQYADLVLRMLR
ncbi:MAG TPA: TetR/AcrR family transcriptional regulator [Micromonosporaceae bacterium]|nr:TetR/AcrR family transcriptional regulator [Micromonosporaceae bacterium]